MFQEALDIARANPEGDRWAEARALTSLASVISPVGDEEECLKLALEALSIGREMGDRFTIAVAQSYAAGSLRRMGKLDEALPHQDEAVRTFRELGARWELGSAIGDRGSLHRLAGRLGPAEADLREALKLCRQLGDRSLIGWTAGELARALLARGDVSEARQVLEQPMGGATEYQSSMRAAEAILELVAGDAERARNIAAELLASDMEMGQRNYSAARRWWVGRLFGDDLAGGSEAVEEARRTLESAHWEQHLREPDLWTELVAQREPA
jgi:tetratricopeptide (TPR) repeat protein